MTRMLNKLLKPLRYRIEKIQQEQDPAPALPIDFDALHTRIYQAVRPYTMTSPERIFGLIEGVLHVVKNNIEGDMVECGVWKGGSMMAIAEVLKSKGQQHRKLYLYDTFEGMSNPGEEDRDFKGEQADRLLKEEAENKENSVIWAYSGLDEVKKAMQQTQYDSDNIIYVKGKVEDTIPQVLPEKIALLRLDTDWYESTRHEMIHLFPRLVKGGVLIVDDYGYWKGSRKAIDEYVAANHIALLLCRMDDTGRIAIKTN
jgi:O-methyltransferase